MKTNNKSILLLVLGITIIFASIFYALRNVSSSTDLFDFLQGFVIGISIVAFGVWITVAVKSYLRKKNDLLSSISNEPQIFLYIGMSSLILGSALKFLNIHHVLVNILNILLVIASIVFNLFYIVKQKKGTC